MSTAYEQHFKKLLQQNEEALLRCLRAEQGAGVNELTPELKARAMDKALRMWERQIYDGARLKARADEIRRRAKAAEDDGSRVAYNWFIIFATFAPGADVHVCFAAVHAAITRHLAPRDYRLTFRRAGLGLQARVIADLSRRTMADVRREVFQLLRGVVHTKDDVRVLTTRTPDAEARTHLDAYINAEDEAADDAWRESLGMARVYSGGIEPVARAGAIPMPSRLHLSLKSPDAVPGPAPAPERSASPPTPPERA